MALSGPGGLARPLSEAHTALPRKVISGGQTGVDRAALDAAMALEIPVGGWCPAGRRAEDGPIDSRYPLTETEETDYAVRTARNVETADGTLVITNGRLSGGTELTVRSALKTGKPCLVLDLREPLDHAEEARRWIQALALETLNVAGPRESNQPGVSALAYDLVLKILKP